MTLDLTAIQARVDAVLNPTAGIGEPSLLPMGGPSLVRLSEAEWQFYLAAQKDVPALIREVQALRGENEEFRERADAALWLSRSALWLHIPQLANAQGPGFGTTMFEAIAILRQEHPKDFPLDQVGDPEVKRLRSRLATVTGAVREWQEARKAKEDDDVRWAYKIRGESEIAATDAILVRFEAAEAALAAFDPKEGT